MTRITESQLSRRLITYLSDNRSLVNKLSDNISTGLDVHNPGDSKDSASIAQFQSNLEKAKSFGNRIASVKSGLVFQDDVLTQASDLMIRAKEIAEQAANETNSPTNRAALAEEVFQLRDHLVSLANSKYQGRYIFGGVDDDDPPFDPATYTNPSSGESSVRYVWDAEAGTDDQHTVKLTENLSITTNTPGDQIFENGVFALERLGRALAGYETLPATGAPDGTGNAYTFPTDFNRQSQAIRDTVSLLDSSRQSDILPEQVNIAGRLRRIETAESLLKLTKSSSEEALDTLQGTDLFDAGTKLSQAQVALQASLQVSAQIFKLSIIDFV